MRAALGPPSCRSPDASLAHDVRRMPGTGDPLGRRHLAVQGDTALPGRVFHTRVSLFAPAVRSASRRPRIPPVGRPLAEAGAGIPFGPAYAAATRDAAAMPVIGRETAGDAFAAHSDLALFRPIEMQARPADRSAGSAHRSVARAGPSCQQALCPPPSWRAAVARGCPSGDCTGGRQRCVRMGRMS